MDLRCHVAATLGQLGVPITHLDPRLKATIGGAWRQYRNNHSGSNSLPRGHFWLPADARNVRNGPRVKSVGRRGNDVQMIHEYRFVFPAGGELESVMGLADGKTLLNNPSILEDIRATVMLNLVANHV